MKRIAILTAYQKEYVKYDLYFPSEKLLKWMFKDEGLELHYVSPHYYDYEKKEFTQHVAIEEHDLKVYHEPYQPDLVWVRMGQALYHVDELFADAPFVTVPSMRLKHIDSDKYQMYQYLKDFQPQSTLLTTYYFYPWLQDQFTKKVVVKPITGSWGYWIEFYTKEELRSPEVFQKYVWTEGMHLVQEYRNFSWGAPGIAKWTHDLRVVFFCKKPVFSMVRVPKKGSLKSNIAGWGSQFSLPLKDIPEKVIALCEQAQEKLMVDLNDMYSLDFAYCSDEKKWYLIELNSSPGIWFPDEDKEYQYQFFNDVAEYFHDILAVEDAKNDDKEVDEKTIALVSNTGLQSSPEHEKVQVYFSL